MVCSAVLRHRHRVRTHSHTLAHHKRVLIRNVITIYGLSLANSSSNIVVAVAVVDHLSTENFWYFSYHLLAYHAMLRISSEE